MMGDVINFDELKNRFTLTEDERQIVFEEFYRMVELNIFHLMTFLDLAESKQHLNKLLYLLANKIVAEYLSQYDKELVLDYIRSGKIQMLNEVIQECIKIHPRVKSLSDNLEGEE